MSNKEHKKPEPGASAKAHNETKDAPEVKADQAAAPEINYQALYEAALQEQQHLEARLAKLTDEIKLQTKALHDKAHELSTRAQAELVKHRNLLEEKYTSENALLKKYGAQKMLEELLEPLINLQVAMQFGEKAEPAVQNYVVGFKMLVEQINAALARHGVVAIVPAVGDHFNPSEHEAIAKETHAPYERIVALRRLGYRLHDRVIKPAKVVISVDPKHEKHDHDQRTH